jgi:transposase
VAQVLVSKYADHLPLYRQAQIFARQGVLLDRIVSRRSCTGRSAKAARPTQSARVERSRRTPWRAKLFADETTAPVLDPGRGRTKTGQLWAYARDDRPWGAL